MASNAYKGRDFDLKLDASIIASATKVSVSPQWDVIEIATLNSGRGKEYIKDMYGYTVSVEGLVFKDKKYSEMLNKALNTDASFGWSATLDASADFMSGSMFVTSMPIEFAVGSAVSYSMEGQGTGDLVINTTI